MIESGQIQPTGCEDRRSCILMRIMLPRYVRSLAEIFVDYEHDYDELFHLVKLFEYLLRSISPKDHQSDKLVDLIRLHADAGTLTSAEDLYPMRKKRNATTHPVVFASVEDLASEVPADEILQQIAITARAIGDVLPYCSPQLQQIVKGTREDTLAKRVPSTPGARFTTIPRRVPTKPRSLTVRQRLDLIEQHARETGGLIFDDEH